MILLCFLMFLATIFVVYLKFRSIYSQIIDFVSPPGDNKPSQLARVAEALSEMVGRAVVASLKGFLMGQKSIEVRQGNAEAGEAVSQSPLGGIVNILPASIKKSLIKNPQLLDLALGYINRQNDNSPGGNHQRADKAKFNL